MKNSEYWQERFRQLEEAQNRLAQTSFKEIEAQYRAAQKELEGKINTWYQRLAKNNNVSMAEARKLLSANELEEFKWSVWDYIKHGEENALDGQWIKQLENASAKFHISKYQALMIDTRQSFEQMFGKQLGTVTDTMGKVFENGYYKTAYELQKGMGIGFDVGKINREEVENVLSKPWAADGKNFSERIWGNKEKLINEVHTQLTQNIITGADPQKAIDTIAKKMNTSKSNAGRLVMTEEAYFSSAAQEKSYKDLGVEQYEVLATLDSHTSEICQNLDGKVFDMKDYKAGVTAPPFHVRCRSTTVPHLDEELWGDSKGERAARDKDGKTYYVPDNMTYPEWKKGFVEGDKKGLKEIDISENGDIIKGKDDLTVKLGELEKVYSEKHFKAITEIMQKAPKNARAVWNDCSDNFHILEPNYKGTKAHYNPNSDGVLLNISSAAKGKSYQTPYQVLFHENGHHIDYILNRKYYSKGTFYEDKALSERYKGGLFGRTLKEEGYAAVKKFADENSYELPNLYDKINSDLDKLIEAGVITPGEREREAAAMKSKLTIDIPDDIAKAFCLDMKSKLTGMQRADISDMFEPIMPKSCPYPFDYGHGTGYWGVRGNGKEAFAEMYSALVSNSESLEQIKKYFPKSYKIFEEMLEVINK